MKLYHVCYIMSPCELERSIDVFANNKAEAYDLATFEKIPAKEGGYPYGAYVASVTYKNGNKRDFNNIIGDPY